MLQEFYNLMYGSDVGIKKFHSEVYKSDNVDVSEWEDGRRVVGCTMPVAIPDVLKSIVGEPRFLWYYGISDIHQPYMAYVY